MKHYEVTIENIRKNPKQMAHVIRCIAAWIAQQCPGLNSQDHTEKTFIAVVRLHLGIDVAVATGQGLNEVMFIQPAKKPLPPDEEIRRVVDDDFTTDIRAIIGVAAAAARQDKRLGEQRSTN